MEKVTIHILTRKNNNNKNKSFPNKEQSHPCHQETGSRAQSLLTSHIAVQCWGKRGLRRRRDIKICSQVPDGSPGRACWVCNCMCVFTGSAELLVVAIPLFITDSVNMPPLTGAMLLWVTKARLRKFHNNQSWGTREGYFPGGQRCAETEYLKEGSRL